MINRKILKNNYQNSPNLNIFERQGHSGEKKMLSVLDPGGGTVVLFIVL